MANKLDVLDYIEKYGADKIDLWADAEECERDLSTFYQRAWAVMDPAPYTHSWMADAIADHLMAVTDGSIKELLINVPFRTGKPVAHDALVLCRAKGLVPLEQIQVDDYVWTHRGRWRRVTRVFIQGNLSVLRVTGRSGRSVDAAPDHPFLSANGWMPLGKVVADDVLGIVPCQEECGSNIISRSESALLGYLVGDGRCSGTPNVTTADDAVTDHIISCASDLGFRAYEARYKLTGDNRWLRRVSITAPEGFKHSTRKGDMGPVKSWLSHHILLDKSSYTKRVPDAVMRGTNDVVIAFLGAYWSCDGTIGLRAPKRIDVRRHDVVVQCSSVSRDLVSQIQILLTRLGINSIISKKVINLKTKRQGDTYTSYNLTLRSQDDSFRFARLIPMAHAKSSKLLNSHLRRFDFDRPIWGEVIASVENAGIKPCRCLSVEEDQSFTANGFAVHNTAETSIAWPCWTWAQRHKSPRSGPQVRFMCLSYAGALSLSTATTARRLIGSKWYQDRWGERVKITADQDNKQQFDTTAGGSRISMGFDGGSLGRGGDIRIIDDPHKVSEAESDDVRQGTLRTYDEALSSRFTDPSTSAIVIIMQRLHQTDLSGHVLEKYPGMVHLMVPMEYEPSRHCHTVLGWDDPRGFDEKGRKLLGRLADGSIIPNSPLARAEGALMWPKRFSREVVERLKSSLGPYASAGQLQQSPSPRGGGIIRPEWWQLWTDEAYPDFIRVLVSVDTAHTEKEQNDESGITAWGIFYHPDRGELPQMMLIDAWEGRLEFHRLVTKVAEICKKRNADVCLVEGKANGIDVINEIRRLYGRQDWSTIQIDPKGDKMARLTSVQAQWSGEFKPDPHGGSGGTWLNGVIWAPDREFAQMVIDRVAAFPKVTKKGLVDTVAHAVKWARDNSLILTPEEHQGDLDDALEYKKPPRPLYDV